MSLLRREKPTEGPLPVYAWLNIDEPKSQTEITPELFQVQRNPDEYQQAQEIAWQEEAARAAAASRTRIAASNGNEPAATVGRKTLTEVIDIDQTDLWPGETAIEAGVSYYQSENLLETKAGEAQVIFLEDKRSKPEKSTHSYSQVAKAGLLSVIERMATVRKPEIDLKKYTKIGGRALAAAKVTTQKNYDRLSNWTKERQVPKFNKKTAVVMGGLALAAAAVGIELYMGHKGAPVHNSNPAQETVNSHTSDNLISPKEFTVPLHAQAVAAQAGHHIHRAHQVIVRAGEGYTQVLGKYFPGKSPAELYHGYQEGIKHLGPNFIKGVHHFLMGNKDYGLDQGKAHLSSPAMRFFAHFRWHR